MITIKSISLTALFIMLCGSACSTPPPPTPSSPPVAHASETHFEITYWLGGRDEHRLMGEQGHASPRMATYLEHETVEEDGVSPEKYARLIGKLLAFAQNTHRSPSEDQKCRSPYSLKLEIDGKTYSSKGCRDGGADDIALGKLIREGEFLLYSKK